MNPTAWLPDDTLLTWAARNNIATMTSSATGRLAIGGREIGDTGWRNIPVGNGWTGNVHVRRTGQAVSVKFFVVDPIAATNEVVTATALPSGFAPTHWVGFDVARSPGSGQLSPATVTGIFKSDGFVTFPGLSGSANRIVGEFGIASEFTHYSAGAWPTVLPGTAV